MYRKWNLLLGDGPWRASPLKSKKHGCASGRPAIWFVFHPFYKRPENSASCQTDGFSSQSHRRFNQMQGMTIFIQKFRKLRRFQASVWKFLLSRHIFTCLCYIFLEIEDLFSSFSRKTLFLLLKWTYINIFCSYACTKFFLEQVINSFNMPTNPKSKHGHFQWLSHFYKFQKTHCFFHFAP